MRQDLIEALYTLQDPVTGQQLIPRIYRKEEIYHGPYLDRAPDLIPVWWEGVTFVGQSSGTPSGDGAAVRYTGMEPLAGGAWSGGHARTGMVIFRGRPFAAGKQFDAAAIIDLAPTLLYLLSVPIPQDMDGRVLHAAFTEEFATTHQIIRCQV